MKVSDLRESACSRSTSTLVSDNIEKFPWVGREICPNMSCGMSAFKMAIGRLETLDGEVAAAGIAFESVFFGKSKSERSECERFLQ